MKKKIITVAAILVANVSLAQWTNKTVNNAFDDPYRICYTKESNGSILKLENVDGNIAFYIQGSYFCSEVVTVDMSFMVNGEWKKYVTTATKGDDSKVLFLVDNLENSEAVVDFLNSTSVKMRVNEEYCDTEYYEFNMSGSTSAYKFIKG